MTAFLISILSTVATVLYLQAGGYVLWRNSAILQNRWFFIFTFTLAVWSGGLIIYNPQVSQFDGFPLFWLSIAGALFIPPVMFRFFSIMTGFPRRRKLGVWMFRVKLVISLLFLAIAIFGGSFAGDRLIRGTIFIGGHFFLFGSAYLLFLAATITIVFRLLMQCHQSLQHPSEKNRSRLMIGSLSITVLLVVLVDLALPLTGLIPNLNIAHFFGLIWVAPVAYGILRQQFFSLTPELASERILEHSSQVVFVCSMDQRVVKTNEFTADLLKLPRNKIIGKPVSSFFSNPIVIEDLLQSTWANRNIQKIATSIFIAGEAPIEVNISTSVVRDSFEDLIGIIVFGTDVRETVQLRKEIELRMKAEQQLGIIGAELEKRIADRTEELSVLHRELQVKVAERLAAEEKIKADVSEKVMLINEIYDRVMRNMELFIFLLNLGDRAGSEPRPMTNRLFHNLAQRINTMLLIHQNLYLSTTYSQVDFKSFLHALVKEVCKANPSSGKIKFDISVQDLLLDYNHAIPLGIIINELLNNALWHAFDFDGNNSTHHPQPVITLQLTYEKKQYQLLVKDNGKGLPEKIQISDLSTNGLPLVEILTGSQLNGKFRIESKEGTSVYISFTEE